RPKGRFLPLERSRSVLQRGANYGYVSLTKLRLILPPNENQRAFTVSAVSTVSQVKLRCP
ncbi:hypothetical protein, partial [Ruegeria atlantica]|uniref:hypothetical protein n=1 Tax=Ruegeria atlantica TaxID=81569 RepID=UPI001C2C36E5